MTAFATHTDLATLMKRTFTSDEQTWVTSLLEYAAGLMRGVMRNQVYPPTTATYTAYPSGGWVDLPQSFITAITTVERDGEEVEYTRRGDSISVDCDTAVDITFTYGLDTAPADLVGINCAMVSGAILTVEAGIGLTAGGLSSVALDDFKAAFADGGEHSGITMTEFTRKYLVERFGSSSWVVEASR